MGKIDVIKMPNYTTVQVRSKTRKALSGLKEKPKESYDDVINKLLELVPKKDEEGEYTDKFRIGLLKARLDIRRGKLTNHSEIKKRIGEPNQ